MGDLFGALGLFGVLAFFLLVIVMPISVYSAQKWAYKCYRELQEINRLLEREVKAKRRASRGS